MHPVVSSGMSSLDMPCHITCLLMLPNCIPLTRLEAACNSHSLPTYRHRWRRSMPWPVPDQAAAINILQTCVEDIVGASQGISLPLWKEMMTLCARVLSWRSMASMASRQQGAGRAWQSKPHGTQSPKMRTWATSKTQHGCGSVLCSQQG